MKHIVTKTKFFVIEKLNGYEILFIVLMALISFFGIFSIAKTYIDNHFLIEKTVYTGSLNLGMVGTLVSPHPYQAENQTDKNLSELLYAPLTDFVTSVELSTDNLSYTVKILPNSTFHNKVSITAEDVVFSFEQYKAEKEALKDIVAQPLDTHTILFTLKDVDPNFNQKLDFKIVPKTDETISGTLSIKTFGSGAFAVSDVTKDENDIITKVTLQRFTGKLPKNSYLDTITIKFYGNNSDAADAFTSGSIDMISGVNDKKLTDLLSERSKTDVIKSSTTENFVLFINQKNNDNLKNKELRNYLSASIDRNLLVAQLFNSLAEPANNILGTYTETAEISSSTLSKAGFIFENGVLYKSTKQSKQDKESKTPVTMTILTVNTEDMVKTGEFIAQQWQQKGIQTTIKTIEKNELGNALKEKDFEILLFGFNIVNNDNYHAFFHSSQISYPKLNISGYANKKVDTITEDLKKKHTEAEVTELLQKLNTEISAENPIIFLYKPVYTTFYNRSVVTPVIPKTITKNENTYSEAALWYAKKERVLSFLSENAFIKMMEIYFY